VVATPFPTAVYAEPCVCEKTKNPKKEKADKSKNLDIIQSNYVNNSTIEQK
jgi:hypothetical protein